MTTINLLGTLVAAIFISDFHECSYFVPAIRQSQSAVYSVLTADCSTEGRIDKTSRVVLDQGCHGVHNPVAAF